MQMSKKVEKTVVAALGLAGAIAFGAAQASENPFALKDLGNGYQVADKAKDGKCGEGKCGGDKKDKKAKDGKCGGDKKGKDGKCGEGKCGGKK
jgi:uncharacterized low-complexity protein